MTTSQIVEKEPDDEAGTKGRTRGKRMKPGRENPARRIQKCNKCGKRGQNHDSRNLINKYMDVVNCVRFPVMKKAHILIQYNYYMNKVGMVIYRIH